ncbi:MAG: NAD(P)H-dependent oxidoreductase [Candidatus Paceibacterota bacterium]|jgi:putative NADPH-quinone reductase
MKKILVINGHPSKESYNYALSDSYIRGAKEGGADIRGINITDLPLEKYLRCTGKEAQCDEIKKSQDDITWAEHIVFIHPVWWSSFPGIMKTFIDLVFTPGFAYKYSPKNPIQEKLLGGRTAHIILTLNAPLWIYKFVFWSPSVVQLRDRVLAFAGIGPTRVTYVGPVIDSTEEKRKKYLEEVYLLGKKLA